MSELPIGWSRATLGQVGIYLNGRAFKEIEWKPKGLPIIRIQNLNNPAASFNYTDAEYEPRFKARSGDLLVAWAASLGAHIWRGGNAWVNQHIFRVDPRYEVVVKQYLYYAIKQSLGELKDKTHGSGIVHVTKGTFESHSIPLPPLSEQKHISAKLDSVIERIDDCCGRLDRLPQILKKFREAVLEAAISGRLTGDGVQFEAKATEPSIVWRRVAFSELISNIRTGTTAVPQDSPTPYPVLRSSSVRPLAVDLSDHRFLTKDQSINQDNFLAAGDLLFTRLSGSKEFVGNCAMVGIVPDRGIQYPDRLFRARLLDPPSARFIEIAFASTTVRKQVEAKVKSSAGHQRVSTDAITSAIVPMPPKNVQQAIVSTVDQLFRLADNIEHRYRVAVARAEKLTPSVLAKAFRGELVPQDPNDEPAEKLLERVRAGRSTEREEVLRASPGKGRATARGRREGGRRLRASSA